jgi:hypothetical protein
MSDGVTVTCGHCGKTDDLGNFIRTVTGELPDGHFQCPHCKRAWRIEKTPVEICGGKVFTTPNKIVPTQSSL